MKKLVNGVEVEMSAEEVAAIEAEWALSAIPKVPESVTPRQIRQALTAINLRASVEAAVAASDQDVKDWWEFATEFRRDHPTVLAMAAGLGVSDAELDGLWILAASL